MCDLYRLFLLLLKLQNRLHPEGCVHHELNVVLYLLDLHTILIGNNDEWDCDGCLNSPREGLFDYIRGCHMVDMGHNSRFFNLYFCFLVFFR